MGSWQVRRLPAEGPELVFGHQVSGWRFGRGNEPSQAICALCRCISQISGFAKQVQGTIDLHVCFRKRRQLCLARPTRECCGWFQSQPQEQALQKYGDRRHMDLFGFWRKLGPFRPSGPPIWGDGCEPGQRALEARSKRLAIQNKAGNAGSK